MQKLKIIFQKRIIPVLTCFMVVLSALVVSAPKADAVVYDYNDYIQNITVDGDNDIVIVSFPLSVSISGYVSGVGTELFTKSNYERFYLPDEFLSSGTYIRFRPIGANRILTKNIPNGTLYRASIGMDMGGILAYDTPVVGVFFDYFGSSMLDSELVSIGNYPVADFDILGTLDIPNGSESLRIEVNVKDLVVHDNTQEVYFYLDSFELQMTISSLYRLQQEVGETNEILEAVKAELIDQGTTLDSVLQKLGVIEANQLDILSILRTISSDLYQWSARIWIDLNAGFDSVVEAISDGLSSGLDTLNNNVQNIITGGENGSELNAGTNEMEQANDKLNGVVDKFDQANEAKPTVPDDITSLINPVQIEESVTFITSVFNYEAMGLDVLYPVLGLVAILAVLFYVLFGKAG